MVAPETELGPALRWPAGDNDTMLSILATPAVSARRPFPFRRYGDEPSKARLVPPSPHVHTLAPSLTVVARSDEGEPMAVEDVENSP